MHCPHCGSTNLAYFPVTQVKTKNRGCVGWAFWILLAVLTCGLILIIPAITNSKTKSKVRTQAVCQTCGNRWNA
ncbi:MAG: hypothetical protein LBJ12_03540 [Oscillospiraceae bacterium]|nr:hypothetical protein [Oscillospiraceae bacterium]